VSKPKPKPNSAATPVNKIDVLNRPKLSKSEVSGLVARAQAGDSEAQKMLFDRYAYLVPHSVERLDASSTLAKKLLAAGNEAINLAIDEYKTNDPEHFSSYVRRWILRRVHSNFQRLSQPADQKQPRLSAYQRRVASQTETVQALGNPIKTILSPQEYEVIQHRFGLDGNSRKTLAQIAALMNKSRQWVCKLEHQAMSKIIESTIK
jgi:RNA polymerase sigma factor (sigma-70 family)